MKSWIEIKPDNDFSLHNIPFGIGLIPGKGPCICTRIGDKVINLAGMASLGYFDHLGYKVSDFEKPVLNDFIAKGRNSTSLIRAIVQERFSEGNCNDAEVSLIKEMTMYEATEIEMLLFIPVLSMLPMLV